MLKLCRKDQINLIDSSDPTNEVTQALGEISFYTANKNLNVSGLGHKPDITGDRSPIVGLKFKRRFTEENLNRGRAHGKSLKRQQSVAEFMQEAAEDYFYSRGDRIKALIYRNYITLFRNYL